MLVITTHNGLMIAGKARELPEFFAQFPPTLTLREYIALHLH